MSRKAGNFEIIGKYPNQNSQERPKMNRSFVHGLKSINHAH